MARRKTIRRAREELWELAQGVSRYLRRHASPAVRLAAALLLAASLAACNASASDPSAVEAPAVAPLQQEVSTGLPRGPGTYPVVPGSVFRDQRGIYQLEWREPGQTAGQGQVAHASRLRLVPDSTLSLEVVSGEDPVLHLPEGENVGLIEESRPGSTQPGPAASPSPYGFWSPFTVGYLMGGASRPAYYDPPRTVVLPQAPGGAGSAARGAGAARRRGHRLGDGAPPGAARQRGALRRQRAGRGHGSGERRHRAQRGQWRLPGSRRRRRVRRLSGQRRGERGERSHRPRLGRVLLRAGLLRREGGLVRPRRARAQAQARGRPPAGPLSGRLVIWRAGSGPRVS